VGISFEEAKRMMVQDPPKFRYQHPTATLPFILVSKLVEESLKRHVAAINSLSERGMKFWDYGNSL
jgi:urocanate hydratase